MSTDIPDLGDFTSVWNYISAIRLSCEALESPKEDDTGADELTDNVKPEFNKKWISLDESVCYNNIFSSC